MQALTKKHKLYFTVLVLTCLGYFWISVKYYGLMLKDSSICLIRNITGLPCPSCGITRALVLFANGNFTEGLITNPLALIVGIGLFVFPVWIIVDLMLNNSSFLAFYQKSENTLKQNKFISIPLIVIVLVNWGWNIYKNL